MPSPPSILGEPKIEQKGANVELHTHVKADPKPEVHWSKDDTEIHADDTYSFADGEGPEGSHHFAAVIKKFDKKHAGMYKATFKNPAGEIHSTFSVSAGGRSGIDGMPSSSLLIQESYIDAPEMPEKPKIVQRDGGKILAIKIFAKSKTEPHASWTKDDKQLTESDRVKFVKKKDEKEGDKYIFLCEIHGPQKDDQAKYNCIVKNNDGSNSQSLNLAFD